MWRTCTFLIYICCKSDSPKCVLFNCYVELLFFIGSVFGILEDEPNVFSSIARILTMIGFIYGIHRKNVNAMLPEIFLSMSYSSFLLGNLVWMIIGSAHYDSVKDIRFHLPPQQQLELALSAIEAAFELPTTYMKYSLKKSMRAALARSPDIEEADSTTMDRLEQSQHPNNQTTNCIPISE